MPKIKPKQEKRLLSPINAKRRPGLPELLFDDLPELIIRGDGGIGEGVRRNRAYMISDASARLALPRPAA